ncbi:hypothetical protein J2X34_005694 [Rhodococcus sp. BE178]
MFGGDRREQYVQAANTGVPVAGALLPVSVDVDGNVGASPAMSRGCSTITGHPPLRLADPRRTPRTLGQPETRTGTVPVGGRDPARPDQPRLLRPQTRRRQAPQRRPDLPGPPPLRRPARHSAVCGSVGERYTRTAATRRWESSRNPNAVTSGCVSSLTNSSSDCINGGRFTSSWACASVTYVARCNVSSSPASQPDSVTTDSMRIDYSRF